MGAQAGRIRFRHMTEHSTTPALSSLNSKLMTPGWTFPSFVMMIVPVPPLKHNPARVELTYNNEKLRKRTSTNRPITHSWTTGYPNTSFSRPRPLQGNSSLFSPASNGQHQGGPQPGAEGQTGRSRQQVGQPAWGWRNWIGEDQGQAFGRGSSYRGTVSFTSQTEITSYEIQNVQNLFFFVSLLTFFNYPLCCFFFPCLRVILSRKKKNRKKMLQKIKK